MGPRGDSLIAASQVVAIEFQTIAAANNYGRKSAPYAKEKIALPSINDAIRLRIVSAVSRFSDLPRPVQGLFFVGLLVVVVILGRWSGALSKGRSRVYWGR